LAPPRLSILYHSSREVGGFFLPVPQVDLLLFPTSADFYSLADWPPVSSKSNMEFSLMGRWHLRSGVDWSFLFFSQCFPLFSKVIDVLVGTRVLFFFFMPRKTLVFFCNVLLLVCFCFSLPFPCSGVFFSPLEIHLGRVQPAEHTGTGGLLRFFCLLAPLSFPFRFADGFCLYIFFERDMAFISKMTPPPITLPPWD